MSSSTNDTSCNLDNEFCGTGNFAGGNWQGNLLPKPGDPSSPYGLIAESVLTGARLSWKYPTLNPSAVAYFIVYRASSGFFDNAIELGKVNGSVYYDNFPIGSKGLYNYWIRAVSIHGTEGELVGPTTLDLNVDPVDLYSSLTEKIDESFLAKHLREKIERVEDLRVGLLNESQAREEDIIDITQILQQIEAISDNAVAAITKEQLARVTSIDALAQEVTTITSEFNTALAGVNTQIGTLASDTQALARSMTTLESELDDNLAQVQETLQTNIETVNGKVKEIGALYSVKVNVNGLAGGFGVYNDGTTIDAGFDVDRFWIGRGNEKHKPFIYSNGQFYFNGPVSFSNIQGAGSLASKDSLSYSEVTGTKPPSDADKTSENTAKDTSNVAGVEATIIKSNAEKGAEAATTVNNWIRPNTTLINGNQIYTGDAYVDTLQIKGQAVTVPVGAAAHGYVPGVTITLDVWTKVLVIVSATFNGEASGARTATLRAVGGGNYGPLCAISAENGFGVCATAIGSFDLPPGSHWITGETNAGAIGRSLTSCGVIAIGGQR